MLPYRDSRLTLIGIGVFFLLAAAYGYFELQGILFGPSITVGAEQTVVHDQFVTISGKADRIASLALNGKDITVTEDGSFSEPYLLTPGENRIILDAKDKYGRKRERVLTLIYAPVGGDGTTEPLATTTATTSTPAVAQ